MNNPAGMAGDPIPQADLDAIRKREEAASIGPWEEYDLPFSASSGGVPFCQGCYCIEWDNQEGDRPFIAHARDDLPRLRIALEATYGRIAELEGDLEQFRATGEEDRRRVEKAEARLGRYTTDEDPEYVSGGDIPTCIECGDLVTDCENRNYCDEIVALRRGRLADRKCAEKAEALLCAASGMLSATVTNFSVDRPQELINQSSRILKILQDESPETLNTWYEMVHQKEQAEAERDIAIKDANDSRTRSVEDIQPLVIVCAELGLAYAHDDEMSPLAAVKRLKAERDQGRELLREFVAAWNEAEASGWRDSLAWDSPLTVAFEKAKALND